LRRISPRIAMGTSAFSAAEVARWRDAGASYIMTSTTVPIQKALCDWRQSLNPQSRKGD